LSEGHEGTHHRVLHRAVSKMLARLAHCRRGGVAMIAAMAIPALLIVSLGAVQLQSLYSIHKQSQDLADSAALWGAQQLTITPSGATSRTQAWAKAQLPAQTSGQTTKITASQLGATTMKVAIDVNVPGFFANLLPPGGFNLHTESTAEGASQTPLCVVVTGQAAGKDLHLTGQSQMQATCLVQSESDITVDGGASLSAGQAEAATTASGSITPTAETGAPIPQPADPFTSLNLASPTPCSGPKPPPVTVAALTPLPPGTYCSDINVGANGTLSLSSGNYYFGGNLNVNSPPPATPPPVPPGGPAAPPAPITSAANVTGTDVVLVFTNGAGINLSGGATFNLSGRQSGPLAGFVIVADRTYTGNFQLQSDNIGKLTGTVYVPTATLQIQGSIKAIQASDWTVIDAQSLQLTGSPEVMINSNYSGSSVPVPAGVGNNIGRTGLTH
jgi:Flp pilus assembly protein TadG